MPLAPRASVSLNLRPPSPSPSPSPKALSQPGCVSQGAAVPTARPRLWSPGLLGASVHIAADGQRSQGGGGAAAESGPYWKGCGPGPLAADPCVVAVVVGSEPRPCHAGRSVWPGQRRENTLALNIFTEGEQRGYPTPCLLWSRRGCHSAAAAQEPPRAGRGRASSCAGTLEPFLSLVAWLQDHLSTAPEKGAWLGDTGGGDGR